ncbi:uncharacterized protein LOC144112457 isoform X2 [Amblyomma americanum]
MPRLAGAKSCMAPHSATCVYDVEPFADLFYVCAYVARAVGSRPHALGNRLRRRPRTVGHLQLTRHTVRWTVPPISGVPAACPFPRRSRPPLSASIGGWTD